MQTNQPCENPKCKKPSTLHCPTCEKLALPISYFCSQQCFASYWSTHKQKHTDGPLELDYNFTGPLRPWKVTPKRTVPSHIPVPEYAFTGTSELEEHNSTIFVYNDDEILKIKESCKLARKVLEEAHKHIKLGVTADEVDRVVHETIIANGAYPSPLNYYGFPKSVCISVNEVICHGIPDLRPFQEGDIVNVDITVYYKGFHGDVNETYFVGEASESSKALVSAAKEGMMAAIAICGPGVHFKKIGQAIQNVVDKYKYLYNSVFQW
jgi:methionyl aminopeptidase